MKAKDLVIRKYHEATAVKETGTFAGGKVRYKILITPKSRNVAGWGQRESWAWAEAARELKLM